MSQKVKRGTVSVEEKSRTDSPVKDMKKKAAANAEKERAAIEKAAAEQKPAQITGKSTPAANQSSAKAPLSNQNGGKTTPTPNQSSGKATPTAAESKPTEKLKDDGKPNKAEKPKETAVLERAKAPEKAKAPETAKAPESAKVPETAKLPEAAKSPGAAKQNSIDKAKANGTDTVNGNGTIEPVNGTNGNSRGSLSGSEGLIIDLDLAPTEEDELFPELAYEDGSDEDNAASGRSRTRREQVKPTRTPETPRPVSIRATADEKSDELGPGDSNKPDTKVLRLRDEYSPSPRRLRSADAPAEDTKNDEIQEEETDKEAKGSETSVKRDTNFSKSRIKVSPYRRSARLQDSMLANYTGNNTTMEMDISEVSEVASTSQAESSYASTRSIRGRRSYKVLGEFVPTPSKHRETVTLASGSRPTVHVVGRKRKTADEYETPSTDVGVSDSIRSEMDAGPAAVKRLRLLERVVTPFTSLVRRTVASSTPLPARRSQAIVGINSDLPLHGAVDLEPEALPALEQTEALKTAPAELPSIEPAVEARENPRQKCVLM